MREYPILFSSEMVRALLDGRKTQTRRVIKPQPTRMAYAGGVFSTGAIGFVGDEGKSFLCPYGKPGDRLWVRETWARNEEMGKLWYRADYFASMPIRALKSFGGTGWKPSIHMPRWASRITLDVVRVRVERLQKISEEDIRAEGTPTPNPPPNNWMDDSKWRATFARLWDSINAKRGYGWDVNPWVWVVEFNTEERHD